MGKKIIIGLLLNCLIAILLIKTVIAEVKINEIFSKPSPGVDWVEFYNDSNEPIDLSTYSLTDVAGNKITFSCLINPKGFITIDWQNNLNNNGDTIKLKNGEAIVDCVSYGDGANSSCEEQAFNRLPAPGYNQSLARIKDGDNVWVATSTSTKNEPNDGSSKDSNAICVNPTPSPTQTPSLTSIPTITPTITPTSELILVSYENIYLSEAMVYPSSGENEWVEIYNDNDFAVFLTNWYLDDIENAGSTPKIFSLEIAPKSYGVFEIPSSIFNNSGDSVRLLDFNKSQKDSFEYSNAQQGKTYGRVSFDSDDFCLQEPSKGLPNNNCLNPTATPTPKPTPSPTPFLTQKEPTTTVSLQSSKREISMIRMIKPRQITSTISHSFTPSKVLGASAEEKSARKNKLNTPLLNSLCFLSFSYSLLTFVSLILKIRGKR